MEKRLTNIDLSTSLRILESKIFVHARANQTETVESFLSIVVRKAKLENKITLIADWDNHTIKDNYLYIIISPQGEIPNIPEVEATFEYLINCKKYTYLRFLKFVERRDVDEKSPIISVTIGGSSPSPQTLTSDKMKFLVAKSKADQYGRTIIITVHIDEIIDKLLTPSETGEFWIPDSNLFYMLDLLLGEYYMTKHIASINFFPAAIFDESKVKCQDIEQARETINDLLKINHLRCEKCLVSGYRTKLNNKLCIYCI